MNKYIRGVHNVNFYYREKTEEEKTWVEKYLPFIFPPELVKVTFPIEEVQYDRVKAVMENEGVDPSDQDIIAIRDLAHDKVRIFKNRYTGYRGISTVNAFDELLSKYEEKYESA